MSLDLFQQEVAERMSDLRPVQIPEASAWDGFGFRGIGMSVMKQMAKTGRAIDMLGAVGPILKDLGTGTTTLQDRYFREHDEVFNGAVDYWTAKPGEVGVAAEMVGTLLTVLPTVIASPGLAVGSAYLSAAEDLQREGVVTSKAQAVGALQAGSLGLGVWMPILGQNLWQRVLLGGVGFNVAQGAATRAGSESILLSGNSTEADRRAAASFEAFNPAEVTLDVLLGAAFGGLAHVSKPMRQQGKETWDRFTAWAQNLDPSQVAAIATLREAQHLNVDSMPGRPREPADIEAHVARMRTAIDQAERGQPIDVSDMPAARVDPDPERMAAAERQAADLMETAEQVRQAEGLPLPPEPPAAPPRPLFERSPEGAPILRTERVSLEEGRPYEEYGETLYYENVVRDAAGRDVGLVALGWRGDQVTELVNIRSFGERQGTGTAVLSGILSHNAPDTEVTIRMIQPEARAFWEKVGTEIIQAEGEEIGVITKAAFDAATARRGDQTGAGRQGQGPAGAAGKGPDGPREGAGDRQGASPSGVELGRPVEIPAGERGEQRAVTYDQKPDGRLTRTVKYPDGEQIAETLHTDKDGNEVWVSNEQYQRGEYYPVQLSPEAAAAKAKEDLTDLGGTAPEAAPTEVPADITTLDPVAQAKAIGQSIEARLVELGVEADEARANGAIWEAFFRTAAEKYGVNPAELLARYGVDVQHLDTVADLPGALAQTARASQSWYYSALGRELERAKITAAPADQWKNYIKGLANKGVKADEITWSGIEEWLDLQQQNITRAKQWDEARFEGSESPESRMGTIVGADGQQLMTIISREKAETMIREQREVAKSRITKEQVLDYMRQNGVRVEEVMAGEPGSETKYAQYQEPGAVPGSYRELLLTLPTKASDTFSKYGIEDTNRRLRARGYDELTGQQLQVLAARDDEAYAMLDDMEERLGINVAELRAEMSGAQDVQGTFISSHFGVPNILAHIRLNERADADGKRVLFVEEFQSDWAQAGRKKGFDTARESRLPADMVVRRTTQEEADDYGIRVGDWGLFDHTNEMITDVGRAGIPYEQAVRNAIAGAEDAGIDLDEIGGQSTGVPPAPFVGKTEAWVGLAMKRVIRYAAENGFDRIAWTTGEQQTRRYSSALRSAVDAIEWTKTPDGVQIVGYKNERGRGSPYGNTELRERANDAIQRNDYLGFEDATEARQAILNHREDWANRWGDMPLSDIRAIDAWLDTTGQPIKTKVLDTTEREDALSDAIGKAMADQILKDPNQSGTIEGYSITVSDTGMAQFYDRIVPQVANDVMKKLGGGKVEKTEIQIPGTRATVPEFRDMEGPEREAFQGAEDFADGSAPMIAPNIRMVVEGKTEGSTTMNSQTEMFSAVMAKDGLHLINDDASMELMVPARDLSVPFFKWGDGTRQAQEILQARWSESDFWFRKAQIIVGDTAAVVKPAGDTKGGQPAFDITPAMRDKAMGGQTLFQRPAGSDTATDARGAIQFGDGQTVIGLFETANKSTFLHESGHLFLQITRDLANQDNVPTQAMKDWARLSDWLGIEGGNIPVEAHEKFARGFEAYVMEGNAPNAGLQGVFQRFRDWLLDIYNTITSLDVDLTDDVRGVMARMLDSQARDPVTAGAPRAPATETDVPPAPEAGTVPPPPRGGGKEAPAAPSALPDMQGPDPWESPATRPEPQAADAPFEPLTVDAPEIRSLLQTMATEEAGWAQIGGRLDRRRLIDATGDSDKLGTPAFTEWIPKADWWPGRPGKLNEARTQEAVRKALAGEKLKKAEQAAVDYMVAVANDRIAALRYLGEDEYAAAARDLYDEGYEPTTNNVLDADTVARATAIDEGAVERAAIMFEDDAEGFGAAIRRIIDDEEQARTGTDPRAAAGGRQADRGTAPGDQAQAEQPGGARPAEEGAGQADPVAAAAERFVADNPARQIVVTRDDGSVETMTAEQYLAEARAQVEQAREDISLFEAAAECLLGGGRS